MGKYIIHFDDKPWQDLDDELYYRCKEIPWFSTTRATISRLIPYTEPDLDAIRKEAYQQGHKDGYNKHDIEKIRKRGYDKGLDDIGNALRLLLFQYSNYTLQEIFGYDTARAVVEHFEGSEIVARIRCYEGGVKQDAETIRKEAYQQGINDAREGKASCQFCEYEMCSDRADPCRICACNYMNFFEPKKQEQEEQIQVGDEVIYNGTTTCVVICPENDKRYASIIDTDGVHYSADHRELTKTGRRFPEIAEVLRKMKETDNG